jgi:hypothetical protein
MECFPDDDGIDTITKTFTVVDQCDYWIDGTFRGAWADEQSTDSFDVVFQFFDDSGFACTDLFVSNLNNQSQCSNIFVDNGITTTTRLMFNISTPCATPYGKGGSGYLRYNQENNSIVIDYELLHWNNDSLDYDKSYKVFKGYRKN